MTRKEWIEKHLPAYVNDRADGGVIGCPRSYRELVRMDPSVLTDNPCKGCHELSSFHVCEECWNQELNLKEERKKTMTRRDFVIKNYGKEVEDITIACGIHGCAKLNLQKLKNRYPDGFTHEASRERKE